MPNFSVHHSMGMQGAQWGQRGPQGPQDDHGGDWGSSSGPSDRPQNDDPGAAITGGMDPKTQFMVTQGMQQKKLDVVYVDQNGNRIDGPDGSGGQDSNGGWDGSGSGWGGPDGGHWGHSHDSGSPGGHVFYVDQNGNPISGPDGSNGSDGSNGDPPPSGGNDSQPSFGDSGNSGGSSGSGKASNNGNSSGWNNNVSIMASSDAQHETTDMYSGGQLVGGYLHDLENGMDQGMNIDQANAQAQNKNTEGATSANVNTNSLVPGKGGKAVIVTGDNYGNDQDADQLAAKLKKDYGMDVQVIKDSSPNQLRAALQQMGQTPGQQCMVAVLAHGAHDDSGQNNGMMALGKGDGDQWLSESDLKSMVNQYLAPNYGNVNVLLNSCYSGNFVS